MIDGVVCHSIYTVVSTLHKYNIIPSVVFSVYVEMDIFGILWVPNFLVWILLLLCALYVYGTWPFTYLASFGYKGPKPTPFLGNIDKIIYEKLPGGWDLIGKKLYGKVYGVYEGRVPMIVVFDTDVLKQVLVKQFASFEDRRDMYLRGPVMKHSLLDLRGDDWKRVRNLTTPFFTTSKLKQNISHLDFCANNLVKRCDRLAASKRQFEVRDVVGAFTLEAICLTAFGIQVDSQNDPDHPLRRNIEKVLKMFEPPPWSVMVMFLFPFMEPLLDICGAEMLPKGTIDYFTKLVTETLEQRQESHQERPDFIQALVKAHEADALLKEAGVEGNEAKKMKALTNAEIVAQGALFIMAGYDTTATALSFLLFNIANNPNCQERLVQEIQDIIGDDELTYDNLTKMGYFDMCLEESLRLFPPALRTERRCARDTTINGYFFPKDVLVGVPVYALHRDPEFWQDPETFDPERFSPENRTKINPYAYQPFGVGPRNCVGLRLAQIEIKMAVIKVIRKFNVTIGEDTKLPLKIEGIFPRVAGGLWLRVERR